MANKKEDKKDPRYNWIHIPENYFDRVKTKIIRSTENGNTKIVLYFKMLDAVKNTDGFFLFQHATQSVSEEIAIQINEDAELVKATLDTLSNLELAEISEDGCYFDESEQFVGTILESTLRVQEWRAKEKARKIREAKQNETHCNDMKQTNVASETNSNNTKQGNVTNETECNNSMLQEKQTNVTSETECNTEKEREKEEEKEIDKEINNNCAESDCPQDAEEVIEMYHTYCPALTKAPEFEEIINCSDGKYKGLYEKLNNVIAINNPAVTTNEFKTVFINGNGQFKEAVTKETKKKGYLCELEFLLESIANSRKKKATA